MLGDTIVPSFLKREWTSEQSTIPLRYGLYRTVILSWFFFFFFSCFNRHDVVCHRHGGIYFDHIMSTKRSPPKVRKSGNRKGINAGVLRAQYKYGDKFNNQFSLW